MGNCLKSNRSDHQSLLRENTSLDRVEGELPPPYRVGKQIVFKLYLYLFACIHSKKFQMYNTF